MTPFPGLDEGTLGHLADSWAVLTDRAAQEDLVMNSRWIAVLMGVSFGIGLLSTLATAFTFYWFVKMRRSFRHE